ncbi:MAG TPA: arsenic resistance N-acetyltransferase ArsN2 [Steroidobacteraceae bacterium]|nr:arsenic resistance N-acetyltransferase ArsN2 [Steroidobacteraceae bacterium]
MKAHVSVASPADLPQIRALLDGAGLPHSDLTDGTTVRFWVVRDAVLLGAIGLESFGDAGLLRSLVVSPDARDAGVGTQLVEALETAAASVGIAELVLLTQTAERFFSRRGYTRIDREKAPTAVLAASEFKTLCPASAACMSKALR